MNDINEIILTIKKVENKQKENYEIKPRKKTYTIEEELKDWIKHLKEKLFNRYYKRVIKDIISSSLISKFRKSPGGYKIIILYIQAHIKIIENKIFKYHLNQNDIQKQKYQINHCFSYANNIQDYLNLLLQEISETNINDNTYYYDIKKRNYKIEIFDDIIRCHFDYIHIMSLLYYKIGNTIESISYLCLFLTLYKETKPYILSIHTLYKIEKCFILLSKVYITNEDYENASKFLNEAIKVCFKQILFQVHDIYYGVFNGEKKDLIIKDKQDLEILKDKRIKRIILNIVIIFLYEGICNEHLSNIKNATAFYKQSEWFSRIFFSKNNSIIYKLFFQLKKNAIEACNIIDFLKNKINDYETKLWHKNAKDIKKGLKIKKYIKKENMYDNTKFEGLIQRLEGLKIQEIDTVNKFEKNKNRECLSERKREGEDKNLFLSNMRLLEAYLRNDFKNIINDMDKINMFDLDYKIRTRVQKVINKIYFENNQKKIDVKNNNLLYKSNQKTMTIKNIIKIDSKHINNKNCNRYKNFGKFDLGDYFEKKQNQKLKFNLFKSNLSQSNSFNSFSTLKGKNNQNSYIKENKIKSKIFFRNRNKINTKNNKKLNHSSSYSLLLNSTNNPSIKNLTKHQETKTKSIHLINEKQKEKSKTTLVTKMHKSKYKIYHPENHKLNEFFNFKYLKKREFIKKLCDRELLFQKLILKSKSASRPSFQLFNKSLVKENASKAFSKIESLVTNSVGNIYWKDLLSEEEYREYALNNRLEKIMLGSLDNRALMNYKKNIKKREKNEKEKEILDDNAKYEKKFENIKNNNKNILNELNMKLQEIYENELKRKKEKMEHIKDVNRQIVKKLYRNKSDLNRLSSKDKLNDKFERNKSYLNLSKNIINYSYFN